MKKVLIFALLVYFLPGCESEEIESCVADEGVECGGVCVNTEESIAHCGGCDQACLGTEECVAGECRTLCSSGETDCDGTCLDLQTSASACGDCTTVCDADEACSAGECVAQCAPELRDCSGSCVDLMTNASHCGECDDFCVGNHVCVDGSCGCAGALTSCGDDCVDLTSSSSHCGQCDDICPGNLTCVESVCGCFGGTTDCSGVCVNTMEDEANCGGCGRPCQGGDECVAGTCSTPTPTCSATWAGCTEADFAAADHSADTGTVSVEMISMQPYSPKCLLLKVGQTVSVAASGGHPFKKQCAEDSVMDSQNGSTSRVTFTLSTPGYYNYRCKFHSSMKGNIKVIP